MNWLVRLADRIHEKGDAEARAQGLTVVRLPGGRRQIYDPRLPFELEARRRGFYDSRRALQEKANAYGLRVEELHLIGIDRASREPSHDSDRLPA